VNKKRIFVVAVAAVTAVSLATTILYIFKPELFSSLDVAGVARMDAHENHVEDASKEEKAHAEKRPTSPEKESETPESTVEQSSDGKLEVLAATDFRMPETRASLITSMVREITALQADMGLGRNDASSKLKEKMQRARKMLSEIEISKITENDVQSIAQYVLSGGDPSVAARFLQNTSLSKQQQSLLNGVINYATAQLDLAKTELLPLDRSRYNTVLDAQLTMAQVQYEMSDEPEKSLTRLSYVANIVPGTLIEEAAIRRMIPLLASGKSSHDLQYWVTRYFRRFANSLYYQDFETTLLNIFVKVKKDKGQIDPILLTVIFGTSGEAKAEKLSRQMLINAVQTGDVEMCDGIEKSLRQTVNLEAERFANSAALLRICKVATGTAGSFAELKKIDASLLSESVKTNLAKALSMAEEIEKDVPLNEEGSFGTDIPSAEIEELKTLNASVAQQLDVTFKAIKEADTDEIGINK
jgi:hypothetical protein